MLLQGRKDIKPKGEKSVEVFYLPKIFRIKPRRPLTMLKSTSNFSSTRIVISKISLLMTIYDCIMHNITIYIPYTKTVYVNIL